MPINIERINEVYEFLSGFLDPSRRDVGSSLRLNDGTVLSSRGPVFGLDESSDTSTQADGSQAMSGIGKSSNDEDTESLLEPKLLSSSISTRDIEALPSTEGVLNIEELERQQGGPLAKRKTRRNSLRKVSAKNKKASRRKNRK